MTWDPGQYLKYGSERFRPALDLMARIDLPAPQSIVDLGCGAGNVTRILAERWPRARIVGVDNSAAMLEQARAAVPSERSIEWLPAELAEWAATATPSSVELVFSNAALHWLDDHARLFPHLMKIVAPGGRLAVQMPSNFLAASHVALQEVAGSARWRPLLGALLRPVPVAPAAQYLAWLSPHAEAVDAWATEYLHVLPRAVDGEHPVIEWMKGAALTPFLSVLDENARRAFIADCTEQIARAYPAEPDGRVLFSFRRVFVVAARGNR